MQTSGCCAVCARFPNGGTCHEECESRQRESDYNLIRHRVIYDSSLSEISTTDKLHPNPYHISRWHMLSVIQGKQTSPDPCVKQYVPVAFSTVR